MSAQDAATPDRTGGRRHGIGNWIGPIVVGLVGIAGIVGSLALGITDGEQPGAGLWPLIVSVTIVVCAGAMGPQSDVEPVRVREIRVVAAAVLLLGLFSWLFTLIGIFFPTVVVLFVWLKFLSGRGWIFSAVTSILTAAGLYAIFTYVFHVGA